MNIVNKLTQYISLSQLEYTNEKQIKPTNKVVFSLYNYNSIYNELTDMVELLKEQTPSSYYYKLGESLIYIQYVQQKMDITPDIYSLNELHTNDVNKRLNIMVNQILKLFSYYYNIPNTPNKSFRSYILQGPDISSFFNTTGLTIDEAKREAREGKEKKEVYQTPDGIDYLIQKFKIKHTITYELMVALGFDDIIPKTIYGYLNYNNNRTYGSFMEWKHPTKVCEGPKRYIFPNEFTDKTMEDYRQLIIMLTNIVRYDDSHGDNFICDYEHKKIYIIDQDTINKYPDCKNGFTNRVYPCYKVSYFTRMMIECLFKYNEEDLRKRNIESIEKYRNYPKIYEILLLDDKDVYYTTFEVEMLRHQMFYYMYHKYKESPFVIDDIDVMPLVREIYNLNKINYDIDYFKGMKLN